MASVHVRSVQCCLAQECFGHVLTSCQLLMSRLQQCCRVCFVSHRRWARLKRPLALNVRQRCIKKQRVGKAKERTPTAAEKRSNENTFVGSVHETTACHRKRHSECPKDAEKCIRCRFAADIHAWKKGNAVAGREAIVSRRFLAPWL